MKKTRNAKGITLIALIITIIVLLILAGITLSTLAGRRGIINQAQNAEKEHTKASALEDITLVTYQSIDNKGNTDTTKLEQGLNDIGATIKSKTENKWTVEQNGYEFEIDIETADVSEIGSYGGIYSEPGLEGKIAPEDLFVYEPITEGTASLKTTSLATATDVSLPKAKITGLNTKYCNGPNYTDGYADTYYQIIYNGETISDILVIPYQVEINGELHQITEVNLFTTGASGEKPRSVLPRVKTIIFPNTVETITEPTYTPLVATELQQVILSKNITSIPENYFHDLDNLTSVELPEKLTLIDQEAFRGCKSLTTITIPDSVSSIGREAFGDCEKLTTIIIPKGISNIAWATFSDCRELTTITIPKNVTSIDGYAFSNCDSLTTVNYEGSEEEWSKITIGFANDDLINATINCGYKYET